MQEILRIIQKRQSERGPFSDRPVPAHDLSLILEAGRWAPTAHNMQNFSIVVVDDPEILREIGRIKNPISLKFIRENFGELSFSEDELTRKKTGILASRFPPAWVNPKASTEDLDATERPLPTSPVMLIVVYDPRKRAPASENDFLGAISLGCVTENMWLMAESLGVSFHIVSSFAGGAVEKEVKGLLNIPETLKIVYAIRMGYPKTPSTNYLRVRRDIEDFTFHNRFGGERMGGKP